MENQNPHENKMDSLITTLVGQHDTEKESQILGNILEKLEETQSISFWEMYSCETESDIQKEEIRKFIYYLFKKDFKVEEGRRPSRSIQKNADSTHIGIVKIISRVFDHQYESLGVLLQALKWCITQDQSHPGRRRSVIQFVLNWLGKMKGYEEKYFPDFQDLVILVITDVWSVIRSLCMKMLCKIVRHMTLQQLEHFFIQLTQIIRNSGTSWQAREGAILAINCIMNQFERCVTMRNDSCWTKYNLKFGPLTLTTLPEFITYPMPNVIYPLLADHQLSIRDNTIKAFSSFLSRQSTQEVVLALEEVVKKLDPQGSEASLDNRVVFLDAFYAESLLGVLIFLTKMLPPATIMKDWKNRMAIFSHYLMHPASTVRQTTSQLFRTIVCKDADPVVTCRVLQDLSSDWIIDRSRLLHPDESSSSSVTASMNLQDPALKEGSPETWQYREGRMLTYELILQYLIKNHTMYTYTTVTTVTMAQCYDRRRYSLHHTTSPSLRRTDKSSSCSSVCEPKPDMQVDRHVKKRRKSSMACTLQHEKGMIKSSSEYKIKNNPDNKNVLTNRSTRDKSSQIKSLLEEMGTGETYMSVCVRNLYHQTISCIADQQWELQRIGKQVLPVVAEVMRWYDVTILQSILASDLTTDTNILCYAACSALNYCIVHAGKLSRLQSVQASALSSIKDVANHLLNEHLDTVELLLQRPICDRLSVVAVQIIANACINFDIPQIQRISGMTLVVQLMSQVFTRAHPKHTLSADLSELIDPQNELRVTPTGIFSCSHKESEDEIYHYQQFEKSLLTELCPLLDGWLRHISIDQTCQVLPLLAAYCTQYADDDLITTTLISSMLYLSDSVSTHLTESPKDGDGETQREANVEMVLLSQREMTKLLNQKVLDAMTLNHILDMVTQLFAHTQNKQCFHVLISAIYDRLQGYLPNTDVNAPCKQDEDGDSDAGSDWDSWDEEDEDQSNKSQGNNSEYGIVKGYLILIQTQLGGEFSTMIAQLPSKEKEWLLNVLKG